MHGCAFCGSQLYIVCLCSKGSKQVVDPLLDPRRRTGMKAWEEAELQDIIGAAGLVGFSRQRRSRYIMFSARKPGDGGA